MLMLLQLRGKMPAARLSELLEVSVRTIYRDIDALSEAGIPIYAEPGRNGGIALHHGYRTRLTGLTRGEADALALTGSGGQAGELGLGSEALAARLKLMASLPADHSAGAERVARRYHVDPIPWYHRAETIAWLPALADAVWHDRRVRIDYEGWRGRVKATVDPLGLVQKAGLWYLVAMASGRPRTYRASNILKLDLLDESFVRPDGFDLPRYWLDRRDVFEADLARHEAVIRISEEGRRILRAVNSAADLKVAATARPCGRPGWVEAEIAVEATDYAARQLLRLGAEVEVMAPDALRSAVLCEASAVTDMYR